ncbi:MAG TPA: HNH endonuclease signature motif containing protein [Polyangiaceae bacterium]
MSRFRVIAAPINDPDEEDEEWSDIVLPETPRELDFEAPVPLPEDALRTLRRMRHAERVLRGEVRGTFIGFESEAQRVVHHNQRAIERGLVGSLTAREWDALCEAFGGCAYCGCAERILLEHVTPLCYRGDTSLENVVPACWWCNDAKGTLSLAEWKGPEWATEFRQRWGRVLAVLRQKLQTEEAQCPSAQSPSSSKP